MVFECKICRKNFSRNAQLMMHLKKQCKEKLFSCEICDEPFDRECNLLDHEAIHFNEERNQILDNHMMVPSSEESFKDCDCLSEDLELSEDTNKEETSVKKLFACELCHQSFPRKVALVGHMRTHNRKEFECKVCYKVFKANGDLVNHSVIHTGEKPFKCHLCSNSFSQKSSLRSHVKLHSGEKPHECDLCHRAFAKRSNLYRHIEIHSQEHIDGLSKVSFVECQMCQRRFTKKAHLIVHMRKAHSKPNIPFVFQ